MPIHGHPFRDVPCNVFSADCPARSVLLLLSEKWSLLTLHALSEGTQRTGMLRRRIGGISEKMLTQTLRRLQEAGLVVRTSYAEVPPRVDYSLTDLGWSLSPLVRALDDWVEAHAKTIVAGSVVVETRRITSCCIEPSGGFRETKQS